MLDRLIVRPFVLWVFVFSTFSLTFPSAFIWFRDYITLGLGAIMLGMGMTLTIDDFAQVFKRLHAVAVGISAQFLIMPTLAFLLIKIFQLDPALSVGIIVVGSCPGGTASNLIAYLAKADVALSVTLTSITTLLAVFLTPLFIWLFAGTYVAVDALGLFLTILQVIAVPVITGVAINRYAAKMSHRITPYFAPLSVLIIILIVSCIVGLNRSLILQSGIVVIAAVVLHNGLGYLIGYWSARKFRLTEKECRTIAIEVGMQNSGLGAALAVKHFADSAVALPSAIFSIWHNISGPALASWWRRRS
ncbi:MAG: bile acid:sodium symporter family protein [Bacteroidota bacterium]